MPKLIIGTRSLSGRTMTIMSIAAIFGTLNVVALATWILSPGASIFGEDSIFGVMNVLWILTPPAYVGIVLLSVYQRPRIAALLLIPPATFFILNLIWVSSEGYELEYVLPVVSLSNFSTEYWAGGLITGLEPVALVALALLLLLPTPLTRSSSGLSTLSTPAASRTSPESPVLPEPPVSPRSTVTNPLAIVAFVSSFIVPFVGLILGYVSLAQINHSGGRTVGRGFAITAIILNWVAIGIVVGVLAFWLIMGTGSLTDVDPGR